MFALLAPCAPRAKDLYFFDAWERSLSSLSVSSARVSSVLLVVAGVLWGTGGLAGAMLQGSAGLGPVSVSAYRLLVGGGLAALVVAPQFRYLRGLAAFRRLLVSALLLAQFQAAYQVAVALVGVSLATLVTIGVVPVCVVGVSSVVERRLPSRQALLAVGGALVGLGLLSGSATSAGGWQVVCGVGMSLFAGGWVFRSDPCCGSAPAWAARHHFRRAVAWWGVPLALWACSGDGGSVHRRCAWAAWVSWGRPYRPGLWGLFSWASEWAGYCRGPGFDA